MEDWLLELVKGIGKLFLNPLTYWVWVLIILAGYRRIKRERQHFGVKIFNVFSEWKGTWGFAIITGLILSIGVLVVGMAFTYETLALLSIIMILLSLSTRFTLLSASYTIGFTYIILLFIPFLMENQTIIPKELFVDTNFIGLSILLGLMIVIEALLLRRVRRNETFPRLQLSDRGIWIGNHQLKKMSVIPLFLLVPGGLIESFAPYWPLISIGGETYGIVLFPFLLGFEYTVKGSLATQTAKSLSKQLIFLGLIVIALSIGSLYVKGLSLAAIGIAIFGREFITYRFRVRDKHKGAYYKPHSKGLKVLGVIPGTPAERLGVQVGEVIAKVNDKRISTHDEYYEALSSTGAYFKLDILDDQGEVRFIQSAFYEDDDYKLGLIFIKEPFRINTSE